MANLLDRFKNSIIGEGNAIVDYNSTIAPSGDFIRVSKLQAVINSWKKVLMIPIGTYMDDPTFGSNLLRFIFKPADEETIEAIANEIEYRLNLFDDRANIDDIDIKFLSNKKGFNIKVYVSYEGEVGSFEVTIDESLVKDT